MRDGRLVVDEIEEPRPGPGQLLVEVLACGICGSDLHFLRHAPHMVELTNGLASSVGDLAQVIAPTVELSRDIVMGHEFSASVLEAGPETVGPASGSTVVSVPVLLTESGIRQLAYNNEYPGGFAQYMLLSAPLVLTVPNGLDHKLAALTEPFAVGVHAIEQSGIKPGASAAVAGCGPVGLAVIAALKLSGIESIVASDFSPGRRQLASAMGATEVVDPTSEPLLEAWRRVDGRSEVVCFEAVGVPGVLGSLIKDAPVASQIVVVGVCMEPDTFQPFFASAKQLCIRYVFAYTPEEFARSLRAISEGEVDVSKMITGTVGLDATPNAFEALAKPDSDVKILVEPSGA
jgi:threonine dehydrogenase-like Zn-dependent dehydrogenase